MGSKISLEYDSLNKILKITNGNEIFSKNLRFVRNKDKSIEIDLTSVMINKTDTIYVKHKSKSDFDLSDNTISYNLSEYNETIDLLISNIINEYIRKKINNIDGIKQLLEILKIYYIKHTNRTIIDFIEYRDIIYCLMRDYY